MNSEKEEQMRVIEGRITASQLAQFGAMGFEYGTISVHTGEGSSLHVKVDAYTLHEGFAIGDNVRIEMEELGKTGIWVARKIVNLSDQLGRAGPESAEMSSSA